MSDFGSLIFYIAFFALSSYFYYLYNKFTNKYSKFILLVLSFIIPLLIGGLRYEVGTDYLNYVSMYNHNSEVDIGFKIITWISSNFTGYTTVFFIYSFLTLFFIYLALNNLDKKLRPLAYFCYLFLLFTSSFNIIRQALAVSIIFYAYKYIINKDIKKWTFFCLIAFCFHNTAVICWPFYFLISNKNKIYKIIAVFVVIVVSWNYSNIINCIGQIPIFARYLVYEKKLLEIANNRMFYVDLFICIYILYFRNKIVKYNKDMDIYILLFILSIAFELSGFFNPYVKRIGNYFKLPLIFILSSIPFVCESQRDKMLNYLLICGYVVGIFIVSTYVLRQANIIPYKFIGG